MPYFINVGRFEGVKSGIGSRGWHIWRRGRTVYIRFGAIEVEGRQVKHFYWAGEPVIKPSTKGTIAAAMREMRSRIAEKTSDRRHDGDPPYEKLPPGRKILPRPAAR